VSAAGCRRCSAASLDIAEPGAEFQVTDGSQFALPSVGSSSRCSYDNCLFYYERGGVAHTWRVALFHWTPDATRFEWGGTASGGLVTIDDVRSAVLSERSSGRAEAGFFSRWFAIGVASRAHSPWPTRSSKDGKNRRR
jgi:hypothetical protein